MRGGGPAYVLQETTTSIFIISWEHNDNLNIYLYQGAQAAARQLETGGGATSSRRAQGEAGEARAAKYPHWL